MHPHSNTKSVLHMTAGRFFHKATAQWLLPLAAVMMLASCHRHDALVRLQGEAQGTYYNICYHDPQHRNLQPQIDSLLNAFDMTASLWKENSLIRKVNRHENAAVNAAFCDLLRLSLQMEEYTHGAFNCKIGSLVNLYGFGFKNRDDITDSQIDSLLNLIRSGQCHIASPESSGQLRLDSLGGNAVTALFNTLDSHYAVLSPGMELDFNAIAQGYAVDMLARMFDNKGIHNYLIDVGGEVIAKGGKPDGTDWAVGIERPAKNKYSSQEIETAITLRNRSVVTSGSYRKYYEHNGTRYSHTIDPSTGRPVSHSLLSVSVVSSNAWYADAMATAFMVMGLDKSLQFIHDHPENGDIQAVFFIYDDHGTYKTHATPAFQSMIIE